MTHIFYVPIYEWGDDPDNVCGIATGLQLYLDLQELYMDPGAIGHMEVTGTCPSENEFKRKHKLKSEAV